MTFDADIYKLSDEFFADYPADRYPELMRKPDRPYYCLLIDIHTDYFICVPFRSNIRTCLHKHMRTSFRQILPQTALKILAGRQPACGFLPCLQQNYARKSAHISYEDRF